MGKKGKRRRVVQPSGPQHMYIIAGLPKSVHKDSIDSLQARLPQAIIKGVPSPSNDGALYSSPLLDTLVRSVGEFALRRRTNGNAQPTPASMTLLFVPAPDQEALLRRFDFALMSAPLSALVARDDQYRQMRHDRESVGTALVEAVAASGEARMNLNQVVRRLGFQSDNEGLLLPPRNFFTNEGDLVTIFRQFREGGRAWTDRLEEFGPVPLTHEDVPMRVKDQQTRRVFVDNRGMAYFIAHPTAYDGPSREVDDEDNVGAMLMALRSLYRFGGALPPGIHHDAQRSNGSVLGSAKFHCAEKGPIYCKADYANVYPNDYVRVEKYDVAME